MNTKPELIINHVGRGEKVLTTLLAELSDCVSFDIAVAFITQSGVACLLETLKKLEKRGVRGRILTSQYLNFTQPHALESLIGFKNLEVKIEVRKAFHSKGYLFERLNNSYSVYIGSSNLTNTALTTNVELNVGIELSEGSSSFLTNYISDFNTLWQNAELVDHGFIKEYRKIYSKPKDNGFLLGIDEPNPNSYGIQILPNEMQEAALNNLKTLRREGKKKALLISATGTGKTFLSAFDVMHLNPNRVLFVVHRRTIAYKSMQTFQRLMPNRSMALYSGNKRGNADFLFATIQTIAKDVTYGLFSRDEFDYIIIDETHRAEAKSYQRILEYFNPGFLLGMTATPERTDGGDVFKLFDHNIAYEIRLHQALNENMLVPFHYFGVADLTVDGRIIDDFSEFNHLISDERVKHISEKAAFYKTDNDLVKGLIFCSRTAEAIELAKKLNELNIRSKALTGNSTEDERQDTIEALESSKIQYIITVDIFNEGVDIPSVNQVIMLRPTQSAIVFVQQLGRGLRKAKGKEYLTVIDFIGNYTNSYLIPIALYGDESYNKDNIRKLLVGGSSGLPGACTINFDEITQEQIFESIDKANLRKKQDLKADYQQRRKILGYKPLMLDFFGAAARDPFHFVDYSGSLYSFAKSINEESSELTSYQEEILNAISKYVNDGKRILDSVILKLLCTTDKTSLFDIQAELKLFNYDNHVSEEELLRSLHCLNLNFDIVRYKKQDVRISEKLNLQLASYCEGHIVKTKKFLELLNEDTFIEYLIDSCNYSIRKCQSVLDGATVKDGFILYEKYTRRDVLRLLGWDKNRNATTIGGYRMSPDKSNCPIFVTYHKADDLEGSIAYEDEFISPRRFKWMSRSNRKIDSNELQPIIQAKNNRLKLPLFVKKDDNEGIDFYYLGDVIPEIDSLEQQYMLDDKGKQLPVVKFEFHLEIPVEPGLYKYLTS